MLGLIGNSHMCPCYFDGGWGYVTPLECCHGVLGSGSRVLVPGQM